MERPVWVDCILMEDDKDRNRNQYVQHKNDDIIPRFFYLKPIFNVLKGNWRYFYHGY